MRSREGPGRLLPWAGRITGGILGLPAGPAGVGFGLLAGWLVDQYRARLCGEERFERFLRRPEGERSRRIAEYYTLLALLGAVLSRGDLPDQEALEKLLGISWPLEGKIPSPPGEESRQALLERSLLRCGGRDTVLLCRWARKRELWITSVEGAPGLVRFLCAAARSTSPGGAGGERRILLRQIARELPDPAREELEQELLELDAASCRLLGVSSRAEWAEIRSAYRSLAAQLHPDGAGCLDPARQEALQEAFVRIRGAYEILREQVRSRESRDSRETRDSQSS
ncbi:DnaJ domain-containing protein [Alkalispirochaeta americana]|uniref:DnaJ domain-containing protein n=1 Tax=Alkalispirochaeta americana TaxID=159291 RepID=A0A1N6S2D1_9SPIO|nr:J domain-containing protein [Alkalispirochaeta americana]SIQ35219.1 DnaJ domain-containing protein [Alkalispirochaeta americana]